MSDTYTVIHDDYQPGMYVEADGYTYGGQYAGSGTITTAIGGDLAERIRQRSGMRGDVTITEERWGDESGCVTCSMESMQFTVQVDDETVYTAPGGYTPKGNPEGAEEINNIGEFNAWLNEAAG